MWEEHLENFVISVSFNRWNPRKGTAEQPLGICHSAHSYSKQTKTMRSYVNKNVFKYCVLYTHPQAFMCLLQFKYDKSYNKLNTPTAYITYNILQNLK